MSGEYFIPLDDDELKDHLRLSLPPTDARAGWQLDNEAILKAIDILQIKLPVRIRFMTGKYRHGTHYSRTDHHRVTIHQGRDAEQSSETLWHELVHCMQAEQWSELTGMSIDDFHDYGYKKADGEWGHSYEENRYEIQASRLAATYNLKGKLCRV